MSQSEDRPIATAHLGRLVFFSFLLTFILSRVVVLLIMTRRLPDLYLYIGGNHVHHLNFGIFLLAGVGGYLLFSRPVGRALSCAASLYGIGLALAFDEFGLWLHLGGSYWQRASWDAMAILAGLLALVAFAPSLMAISCAPLVGGGHVARRVDRRRVSVFRLVELRGAGQHPEVDSN